MGKYRNRLQIIADVLAITAEGAKKTQIMYQANLSYSLLNRYLAEVLEAGLVSFEDNADYYILTQKGRSFLKEFDEYSMRLKWLEAQFNDGHNQKVEKMSVEETT